ncbi:putative L-cysteine desulfhydrase 1 [Anneissia japonica]|uniref:putative L-cysteine desulfhydrase 1 n=1 Tax=Anneissia japonica TaxID=1529436 RepID=UPI0014254B34|nr:putative L-cysteine desulfhydrase 1 [Anneissia japonica]
MMVFGKKCKKLDFMLTDSVTFCNHGGFGGAPRKVIETQRSYQLEQESDPEGWYRYRVEDLYSNATDKVAEFVGSDKENLVLVENVTTGVNTVLKSLQWLPGDKILITNQTFEAVKNTLTFMNKKNEEIEIVTMDIRFPIENKEQLVYQLEETLDANKDIKMVILDHIISVSAILMPIEDMIPVCHQRGVMVMVDGAHAPGQVQLQLDQIGADFYTGDLHKWCFTTRGCALLHVDPKHSDVINPLVTAYLHFHPRLRDRFVRQSTRDCTSMCIASAAIEFLEEIGGLDVITQHNTNLVDWAVEMLANAWKTKHLPVPRSLRAPFMSLVMLPADVNDVGIPATYQGSKKLMGKIYKKYAIHCACTAFDGRFWVRVSAQIHNCKEDYFKLRDAITQEFIEEPKKNNKTK